MRKVLAVIATAAALLTALPAQAQFAYQFRAPALFTHATRFEGAVTHAAAVTNSSTVTNSGNTTVGGTLGVTGGATFGSTVGITGNTTVGGTLGVTGALTLTVPLTKANANASLKRIVQVVRLSPETGACADATVYRGIAAFKRAGTVTGINYGAAVVPTTGTNVIAVEKNSFTGNTMLNAASVTLNSATIGQAATLTAIGADLALTADQVVALEYNAGTQDTDAQQVYAAVEFEPNDQ